MGSLRVETKQRDSDTGWALEFDKLGTLMSQQKLMKNVGTTVRVKDLFQHLPVRLGEF